MPRICWAIACWEIRSRMSEKLNKQTNKQTMVAQSSEQAPFTSEIVGSILATDSCEKSKSTLCRKSWVFSGCSGFLPQGKSVTGWVKANYRKHCCGNICDSRCFLKCFPVCPPLETLLRKQNLLPEKQKC